MPEETHRTKSQAHDSPHGLAAWLYETITAVSMTVGRSHAARAVADLACLQEGEVLIDVGCGPGTAVREAFRRGAHPTGVDPSGQMLRLGRWITSVRQMSEPAFVEGTAECLPLDDKSASVVWALSSVHHWSNVDAGLTEARRVLVPGGRLLLAERLTTPAARGHARHGLTSDGAETLAKAVTRAGFTVNRQILKAGHRTLVVLAATSPTANSPTDPDRRPT
jgi:ubiquinone/menaquinone biosynthesis C-methylase UbiE